MKDKPLTTAEQLEQWRRLVSWTLWKMSTDVVEVSAESRATAERLFKDTSWVANVVGEFGANVANADAHTMDWRGFIEEES